MNQAAQLLVSMLDELGHITDEPGRLTRTFLSPAMRRANQLVGDCMNAAGLDVWEDSVGNLIGRYASANPKAKTLLLGSHLDTVRDAGSISWAARTDEAIAALTQCFAEYVSRSCAHDHSYESLSPWLVRENKWRAARYGMDASVITPNPARREVPLREGEAFAAGQPAVVRAAGATSVHIAADFGPYGQSRDDAVEAELAKLATIEAWKRSDMTDVLKDAVQLQVNQLRATSGKALKRAAKAWELAKNKKEMDLRLKEVAEQIGRAHV